MALKDRIKEARVKAGLNQGQVGELIGISKSTISEYESGKKVPTMNAIYRIMKALNVDANFLLQDEMHELFISAAEPTPDELQFLGRYRSLDRYGKDLVDAVLEKELVRCREQGSSEESRRESLHRMLDAQLDQEKEAADESEDSMSG